MSSVLLIANGAAYGQESLFNALRLAITLKEQQPGLDLKLFLMSDAVVAGIAGQQPREGYHLQQMLEILTAQQVTAAQNSDIPSRGDIQSQLDALNKQKTLTSVEKLSQQDLTHTIELLDTIERTRQQANELKQQLQQAPAKLQQVTKDLEALKNPANEALTRAELQPLSLRQLES
uniref:Mechanosensitive ion channel MscS porin domain-containing protein n=1 Tax=Anopheles maculatus TaxID=74869 RepID=A0A182SZZ5_9DIPT